MKRGMAIVIGAALAGLAPAEAQVQGMQPMPMPDISNRNITLPPEPEARADGYRLQGRCDVAVPIYRALVSQGTGYELAEFNLGRCLLEQAKNTPDAAAAATLRHEAADWTVRAANSNLPNAQNGLIAMYLDGEGLAADPVEAGKWSLLYHGNATRRMYGLPDVDPGLQARLDSVLTEKTWAVAQSRAAAWSPVMQAGNGDK
jgi:hypothetical protein